MHRRGRHRKPLILLIAITLLAGPAITTAQPATPSPAASPVASPVAAGGEWWHDAVCYEVFVRSFYDSDGDGIGDINGLIEKLDYLNDGVDQADGLDLG